MIFKKNDQNIDIGILFLIFNRPQPTSKVFEQIRTAKPKRLYVCADGPRDNIKEDIKKCQTTRQIIDTVDWDCSVKRLFLETNAGCGLAVSNAINWFFEHESEGIILEDDCWPENSFFLFCQHLLEKYRNDSRIMHINGNNFNARWVNDLTTGNRASYCFSSFPQVWGWATWRRAWEEYDFKMKSWPVYKRNLKLLGQFPGVGCYFEKSLHLDRAYEGRIDTWDFQWQYAVLRKKGLAVVPKVNLVSNIGYGNDSTHLKKYDESRNNLRTEAIGFPLRHPSEIRADKMIDQHYVRHMDMTPKLKNSLNYIYKYLKPLKPLIQ